MADLFVKKLGTPELKCSGYVVDRQPNALVKVHADFFLAVSPRDIDAVAEALFKLEHYLTGTVSLVRGGADTRPRCFYCASLNDHENTHCASCAAPL